jgi:hypothetical protein
VTLLTAETAAAVVPRTWTIAGISPFYGVAVLLTVLRHCLAPRPTVLTRAARAVERWWRDDASRRTWCVGFGTRAAVLLAGYLAVVSLGYTLQPFQFRLSHNEVWNLPGRFDAGWYLGLARRGYHWRPELAARQQNVAFFPAFPVLMRVAGDLLTLPARVLRAPELFGNGDTRMVWGGVVVSVLAFSIALTKLRRHVRQTGDADIASRTVLLVATYPFAVFYSAPYSEGVFLLATVVAMSAWTRDDLRTASAGGLLAGLTRPNGWALSIALLVGALSDSRPFSARSPARWLAALSPALGTAAFSVYIGWLTGDPFAWARAQQGWGREPNLLGFIRTRADRLGAGLIAYVRSDPVDLVSVVAALGFIILAGVLVRRRDWIGAAFVAVYLLPALAIDLPAIGRMTAVLFPAFIALASILTRRQAHIVAGLFGIGQVWLAARFFTWRTPF